jgi:hypothetical protein
MWSNFITRHHGIFFGRLNAVDFSKPNRSDVEEIMEQFVPDFGTDNS